MSRKIKFRSMEFSTYKTKSMEKLVTLDMVKLINWYTFMDSYPRMIEVSFNEGRSLCINYDKRRNRYKDIRMLKKIMKHLY